MLYIIFYLKYQNVTQFGSNLLKIVFVNSFTSTSMEKWIRTRKMWSW